MEPKRPYTETEPETAAQTPGTAAPETAPEKPREPFFRRRRRELADIWREIYCNSRVRRIRTWQIAVFALMIVEAAVMAIASSYLDKPIAETMAAMGEVGLSGEIRAVSHLEQRLSEAERLGFTQCIIPANHAREIRRPAHMELLPVRNIGQALQLLVKR